MITKILIPLTRNVKHFVLSWNSAETHNLIKLEPCLIVEGERSIENKHATALLYKSKLVKASHEITCFNYQGI